LLSGLGRPDSETAKENEETREREKEEKKEEERENFHHFLRVFWC